MKRLPRTATITWLAVLFCVVLYRAQTQSFTVDEAFCFDLYVDRDLSSFVSHFDACNHVLHTFLTWCIRQVLGSAELVLRSVSLLGCVLYFGAVWRLTALLRGEGWFRFVSVVILTCHPLVLDFMVASRGYGLALGLFCWSLYFALVRDKLSISGVCAGLAIAANLTLVFPVVALGGLLMLFRWRQHDRPWEIVDRFAGPAFIVAFCVVILPLLKATPASFYFGVDTFEESAESLLRVPQSSLWMGALLLAALGCGLFFLTKPVQTTASLICLLLPSTAALLAIAHTAGGLRLPYSRTGLYLVTLCGLVLVTLCANVPVAILCAAISVIYVSQFNVVSFTEWKWDTASRELVKAIAKQPSAHGPGKFQVASSPLLQYSVKYYRTRNKLHYMSPNVETSNLLGSRANYFVLHAEDRELVPRLGLRTIYEDTVARSLVAVRP